MLNAGKQQTPQLTSSRWSVGLRQIRANRTAWGLVAGVVVMILGWRSVVAMQRPANVGKITMEYAAVAEFWGEPAVNRSGTRIVFQQSTENGVGIFLGGIPNGHRLLIHEKPEKDFGSGD